MILSFFVLLGDCDGEDDGMGEERYDRPQPYNPSNPHNLTKMRKSAISVYSALLLAASFDSVVRPRGAGTVVSSVSPGRSRGVVVFARVRARDVRRAFR